MIQLHFIQSALEWAAGSVCICHSPVPPDLTGRSVAGRTDDARRRCQRRGARPSDQQITLNTNNHITLSADLYTALFKRPPLL